MEKNTIEFVAEGQVLTSAAGEIYVASNTVEYIEAVFHLGDNWSGFDSVRAVWYTLDRCVASVLAIDGDVGTCIVPHEVLRRARKVVVNLVGSTTDGEEVIERLTTYPITAIDVNAYARADGDNCAPITPSQFEQFVNAVREEVANIKDIDRAVLNADYTLTIYYSDGTTDTVGPIRGEQGPQGEPGPQGPPGEVDAETLQRILPTDSASGSIASFPDGSDLVPMQSLTVSIEPVQDLHGYDKPWSGGAGANLLNVNSRVAQTSSNVVYSSDSDYIYMNGTKQGGGYADISTLTMMLPAGTYYLRAFAISGTASHTVSLYAYDGSANITSDILDSERSLTLSEDKTFRFRFAIWNDGAVISNYKIGIVVSKTSGIASYTPYSNICPISGWDEVEAYASPTTSEEDATAYTTTLPSTVYGGTLDMVSGELTVDRAMVDMSELNWSVMSGYIQTADLQGAIKIPASQSTNCEVIAEKYVASKWSGTAQYGIGVSPDGLVGVQGLAEDATGKMVYALAQPTTTQLTPQEIAVLLGTNNVWSDAGQTRVVYSADIQKYIDKKLQ